jgi:hypothetical protein
MGEYVSDADFVQIRAAFFDFKPPEKKRSQDIIMSRPGDPDWEDLLVLQNNPKEVIRTNNFPGS